MSVSLLSEQAYLEYTDENVLFRFSNLYDLPEEEITDLFRETKKFIAICTEPDIYINDDLLIIDEMWHNFILFTPVYASFCTSFFQRFIHHIPLSKKEKEAFLKQEKTDPEKARTAYMGREERLISTVYELCGEETVIKWFSEYPEKYTREYIKSIQK
ncbi:hypothetical protein [Chryseobacterium sp.]|uniref:hypothetical protein n=1 Tax=Chryseobacterium sp. TaxID=1871047 RepID=UPI0025C222BF|nr:hypothetical protein [Chryseobacterium sp.]MBV8326816.1 hypothetical protein [Chryseobacterium sp.]